MGAQQRLVEQINAFGELAAILVKVKSLEKATLRVSETMVLCVDKGDQVHLGVLFMGC